MLMAGIAIFAGFKGTGEIYPLEDSDGNVCGRGKTKDYPGLVQIPPTYYTSWFSSKVYNYCAKDCEDTKVQERTYLYCNKDETNCQEYPTNKKCISSSW
jgi:hypothetical protein